MHSSIIARVLSNQMLGHFLSFPTQISCGCADVLSSTVQLCGCVIVPLGSCVAVWLYACGAVELWGYVAVKLVVLRYVCNSADAWL